MICYRCGSVLGSGTKCLHCGAQIAVYRKIVGLSNACYNTGLELAQVRDLSGAIQSLNRALEYDKRNIRARNLLGLVYYEIGEYVEAISHWVISKNYQEYDNPAEQYLEEIRKDKQHFEIVSQAIKRYNKALDTAKHEGEDLAIIQLRSILRQHPKYVRAYELLILLYIKEESYSKANKLIKRVLSIDKGNLTCQRYAKEIKGKNALTKVQNERAYEAALAEADVIVPGETQGAKRKQIIFAVAATAALAVASYVFLISPTLNRDMRNTINQNEISYYEKSEDKDAQIKSLTAELEAVKTELETDKRLLELYEGEDGFLPNYERILTAAVAYRDGDYDALLDAFSSINKEVITSEAFLAEYEYLNEFISGEKMVDKLMEKAVSLFDSGKYTECMEQCERCLNLDSEYVKAVYYTALCYEAQGQDSEARPYFEDIVNRFPSSEYYDKARRRL